MTAFIIDSYKTLSPDPASQSVQLLTQIVTLISSYTVTGTLINSTNSPTAPTLESELSPHALLINALWFSSLVLTLVTASIGILIKQWLREYKGVNNPQFAGLLARIRIRQFREPALRKWKVFEIAAVLPLLIQIALLLFLVGLCYFTWSIRVSIAKSNIPIATMWLLFIFTTSLMLAFLFDCPWKIT